MQLERYIKWALGLKKWNSDFSIREETKIREVCIEAGERVLKYEEKWKGCKVSMKQEMTQEKI